ncbi:MAG: hypothetical protein PHF86_03660 [Candidatus Nanoarchaeia archaeon]|nr:hypothetical protein [Candidatus Nanoarchaeia archaeon]
MKQETLVKLLFALTFLIVINGILLLVLESSLPILFFIVFALVYSLVIAFIVAFDNKWLLAKMSSLWMTNLQVSKQDDPFIIDFNNKFHQLNLETQKNIDTAINISSQLHYLKENLKVHFVGALTTRKYHDKNCRFAGQIKDCNKVNFKFESDARKQGFSKCKCLKL